jgi:hypothetical protein
MPISPLVHSLAVSIGHSASLTCFFAAVVLHSTVGICQSAPLFTLWRFQSDIPPRWRAFLQPWYCILLLECRVSMILDIMICWSTNGTYQERDLYTSLFLEYLAQNKGGRKIINSI